MIACDHFPGGNMPRVEMLYGHMVLTNGVLQSAGTFRIHHLSVQMFSGLYSLVNPWAFMSLFSPSCIWTHVGSVLYLTLIVWSKDGQI